MSDQSSLDRSILGLMSEQSGLDRSILSMSDQSSLDRCDISLFIAFTSRLIRKCQVDQLLEVNVPVVSRSVFNIVIFFASRQEQRQDKSKQIRSFAVHISD